MSKTGITQARRRGDSGMVMGVLLLGLGTLFLLHNLDLVYIGNFWSYWPFILVAFGLQKLVSATTPDNIENGVWLVFIGLWLYVSLEEIWGLDFGDTWPALLVVWGMELIWRSFGRPMPFSKKETLP